MKSLIVCARSAFLVTLSIELAGCSSDSDASNKEPSCPAGAECWTFDEVSSLAETGLTPQNGTISIDATKPRAPGGKSLHFLGMTSFGGRAAAGMSVPSSLKKAFYGRAWMYAAQPNAAGKNVTLIEVMGRATSPEYASGSPFDAQFRLGVQNDGPLLKAGYETPGWYATPATGPHTDCWMHSAVKMPVNQWFCMSWHFDTATQRMSFAVDSQTVLEIGNMGAGCVGAPPDATLGGKWVYPAEVDSLTFGWQEYEASTGTRELWIDDIALGPNPLSCE